MWRHSNRSTNRGIGTQAPARDDHLVTHARAQRDPTPCRPLGHTATARMTAKIAPRFACIFGCYIESSAKQSAADLPRFSRATRIESPRGSPPGQR
jgi:hypothetical protein